MGKSLACCTQDSTIAKEGGNAVPAGSILSFGNARERVVCGQQHWHFTPELVIVITVFVNPLKEQA